MGIIFLCLFVLAETALMVLTLTKCSEKSNFLKNRAMTTVAEFLVLLLIVVLPTTFMKWRFACALAMLFVRAVLAGISFFAKGKKVQGVVRKSSRITASVLAVVLMSFSLVPSFIFSNYNGLKVTGEYKISECNAILIDSNRKDTFENDGSYREVPVHFYYPEAKGEFPLVIFSHGAFGYYQSNFSTYAELASNGYIVAALDHPHHAFFTNDSDGKMILVDSNFFQTAMNIANPDIMNAEQTLEISEQWMKLRTEDESFVLDTIKNAKSAKSLDESWVTSASDEVLSVVSMTNTDKIGLMGHSMGGATAVSLGRERKDIDAVINLDGSMLGEIKGIENGEYKYVSEPYTVPVLDFRKECDYNEMEEIKNNGTTADDFIYDLANVNDYIIANAENGKTVVFKNAGHMDFTDLPMFSPFLGSMLGSGDVDNEEFMYTVNSVVLDWFDYYLKGEGSLDIKANY
ncbi:MAG: dienelactone hydrolase family protein [Acutalibacteraceae bacterium]|nr:dienelactone hydrolase family protein [Acutalibacteraceae bacterium]